MALPLQQALLLASWCAQLNTVATVLVDFFFLVTVVTHLKYSMLSFLFIASNLRDVKYSLYTLLERKLFLKSKQVSPSYFSF